jgi:hypothetical protein
LELWFELKLLWLEFWWWLQVTVVVLFAFFIIAAGLDLYCQKINSRKRKILCILPPETKSYANGLYIIGMATDLLRNIAVCTFR